MVATKRFRSKILLAFLALVLACGVPRVAHALPFLGSYGLWWSGTTDNGKGSIALATNRYNAALYMLGQNPNDITSSVREKLSDESYGGRFYTFAQALYNPATSDDIPTWLPVYMVAQWYYLQGVNLGGDSSLTETWIYDGAQSVYDGALEDLRTIVNGGDVGGDSGGIIVSDGYATMVCNTTYGYNGYAILNSSTNQRMYFDNTSPQMPASYVLRVPVSVYNGMDLDTYDYFWVWRPTTTGATSLFIACFRCVKGTETISYSKDLKGNSYISGIRFNSTWWQTDNNAISYTFDGTNVTTARFNVGSTSRTPDSRGFLAYQQCVYVNGLTPPPPNGNWPTDEPTDTPEPPELPAPVEPIVNDDDDDDDDEPTVRNPVYYTPTLPPVTTPTIDPNPTNTTPQDYTPWLEAILNSLNALREELSADVDAIIDGMNEQFQQLNDINQNLTAVGNQVSGAITSLGNKLDNSLRTHCNDLKNQIAATCYDLEQYLQDLFDWLGQQLSYIQSGYDDSALLRQLREISSKLGGGTYRPNPGTNPGDDDSDFWQWLRDIILGWLQNLVSKLPQYVQDMIADLHDLTRYFPFSVPWDLYGLIMLFAHEPVTPVVHIPVDLLGSAAEPITVDVDLSDYDEAAAMIRAVEEVLFVGILLALSLKMWSPDKVIGGGDS